MQNPPRESLAGFLRQFIKLSMHSHAKWVHFLLEYRLRLLTKLVNGSAYEYTSGYNLKNQG